MILTRLLRLDVSRSLPGQRASRKQGGMNHLRKLGLPAFDASLAQLRTAALRG